MPASTGGDDSVGDRPDYVGWAESHWRTCSTAFEFLNMHHAGCLGAAKEALALNPRLQSKSLSHGDSAALNQRS